MSVWVDRLQTDQFYWARFHLVGSDHIESLQIDSKRDRLDRLELGQAASGRAVSVGVRAGQVR